MKTALYVFACAGALAVTAAPANAKDKYPFAGKWSESSECSSVFVKITDKTYTIDPKRVGLIKSVERSGKDYLITLTDGYRVSLFDVSRNAMTWHSPESGDTFDLRRCR